MQSTDIFAVKANIGVAAMFDINTMAAFLGGCTALDFAVLIWLFAFKSVADF